MKQAKERIHSEFSEVGKNTVHLSAHQVMEADSGEVMTTTKAASLVASPNLVQNEEDKQLNKDTEMQEKPPAYTPVDAVAEANRYGSDGEEAISSRQPPQQPDELMGDNDDVNIDAHEAKIRQMSPPKKTHVVNIRPILKIKKNSL